MEHMAGGVSKGKANVREPNIRCVYWNAFLTPNSIRIFLFLSLELIDLPFFHCYYNIL